MLCLRVHSLKQGWLQSAFIAGESESSLHLIQLLVLLLLPFVSTTTRTLDPDRPMRLVSSCCRGCEELTDHEDFPLALLLLEAVLAVESSVVDFVVPAVLWLANARGCLRL